MTQLSSYFTCGGALVTERPQTLLTLAMQGDRKTSHAGDEPEKPQRRSSAADESLPIQGSTWTL